MNAGNLSEKISYDLNVLLIIVVVGLLVYQQRLVQQLTDSESEPQVQTVEAASNMNTLPEDNIQTTKVAEGNSEQLAAEVDSFRYQLEASEEELDMARDDLADARSGPGDVSNLIAMEKKMRENPSVMAMERRMAENMLVETYGALFEKLGLQDDELQALKTLMVDNQMKLREVSVNTLDESLSEEEKREIYQQIEDQNLELKNRVKELLGADNYEAYNAYEERLREYMLVDSSVSIMSANLNLSDEKEQKLVDAMYEARKKVEAAHGIDSADISETVNQNPEEAIERQLEIINGYIDSGRSVLSGSEAEQFETTMNERKEMMKVSLMFMESSDEDSQ